MPENLFLDGNSDFLDSFDTGQQAEHPIGRDPASDDEHGEPRIDTPVHVIAERSDTEVTRYRADAESENRFRSHSLVVQWCLFFATLAAFGAAVYYAHVAAQQRDTMNGQWDTMKTTVDEMKRQTEQSIRSADAAKSAAQTAELGLEISERAYLSVGQIKSGLGGGYGLMQIPLTNYGHTPSAWRIIRLTYRRGAFPPLPPPPKGVLGNFVTAIPRNQMLTYATQTIRSRDDKSLAPGSETYALVVQFSNLRQADQDAVRTGTQFLTADGTIEYDTGFHKSDTIQVCATYRPANPIGNWTKCDVGGSNLRFTVEDANRTRPQ